MAGGRKGRLAWAYRRRALAFRADLERLTADGEKVSREDLLDVFMAVYKRAYNSGFQTGLTRCSSRDQEAAFLAAKQRGAA